MTDVNDELALEKAAARRAAALGASLSEPPILMWRAPQLNLKHGVSPRAESEGSSG